MHRLGDLGANFVKILQLPIQITPHIFDILSQLIDLLLRTGFIFVCSIFTVHFMANEETFAINSLLFEDEAYVVLKPLNLMYLLLVTSGHSGFLDCFIRSACDSD